MQIHQLPSIKQKRKQRIGRSGKRGNYSGRGNIGQNARSGSSRRLAILDLIKKIPKLRGVPARRYKKQGVKQYRLTYAVINLDALNKKFEDNEVVSPQTLLEKRLVHRIKGRVPHVKILGRGKLTKKLVFQGVEKSKNVK